MSEKIPVAVNGAAFPVAMLGLAGVKAIDCNATGLTVITDEPLRPPKEAVMVDVPVARAVARPVEETLATERSADTQVTWLVKSRVELSENEPVAVKCWVVPLGTLGSAGVTAMDCKVGVMTISTTWLITPERLAPMIEVPEATPVARPEAEMETTEATDEAQVT